MDGLVALAITLIVSNMILIGVMLCQPRRIQVTFFLEHDRKVMLTARPESWPDRMWLVMTQVPARVCEDRAIGCMIEIAQAGRVLDVHFDQPVRLRGALTLSINRDSCRGALCFTGGPTVDF